MDKKEMFQAFLDGYNCAQIVVKNFEDKIDLDINQALKAASAFEGGMYQGKICGAVTGGCLVLSFIYGNDFSNQGFDKDLFARKVIEFQIEFEKRMESCECRDILEVDLGTEEGMKKFLDENMLENKCVKSVAVAIEILNEIIG